MSLDRVVKNNRFQSFAPAILKVYRRDKEAFWAAVMAPFMPETTFLSLWQHRKVTADLFFAFQGLEDEARQVLREFSDWTDLEGDLAVGHYSYVTLGAKDVHDTRQARQVAKALRDDQRRVTQTYECSMDMLFEARAILQQLNDPFLVRLVDVTDLRLKTYFRKELKHPEP